MTAGPVSSYASGNEYEDYDDYCTEPYENCEAGIDVLCNEINEIIKRVKRAKSPDDVFRNRLFEESQLYEIAEYCWYYELTKNDKTKLKSACNKLISEILKKNSESLGIELSLSELSDLSSLKNKLTSAITKSTTLGELAEAFNKL